MNAFMAVLGTSILVMNMPAAIRHAATPSAMRNLVVKESRPFFLPSGRASSSVAIYAPSYAAYAASSSAETRSFTLSTTLSLRSSSLLALRLKNGFFLTTLTVLTGISNICA